MVRPSECPVTGRDAFDLTLDALGEIVQRPHWLLRTILFPFVAVWLIQTLFYALDQSGGLADGVWIVLARWTVEIGMFLPCLLAWCRIGFLGVARAEPPRAFERTGLREACDLLFLTMGTVTLLAVGLDFVFTALTGARTAGFPAQGLVLFAAGLVVVPGIMFGGVRLLVGVAAAAIGWRIGYTGALVLTANHAGWLAGLGLTFLCLFPLATQSVAGMRELMGGPFADLPGVWRGVAFALVALVAAASAHAVGHALRRLHDGMPKADGDQEIG
ncbi:membrane hypothetical protein [uncultured Alphaproteobacteria bacterium]|uniref:Uncharacterized protein n=1 Tax=uncultured Alphaproteobacteria bacterium TaxID=91750 RepID=A0A212IWW9_9PROT|nr:membrane hypothetical protein [uncultured Alphaproteobacteria bacterium]